MAYKDLLYDKSERVATITFNRPDRMNAWTRRMDGELREAMLDAENDPGVGAVIVTGAGRAYCAGADLGGLSKIADGSESVDDGRRAEGEFDEKLGPNFRGRFSWLLALHKPVIAAINGACVGMGFTHSLYFDIRIASERARMGLIFVRRGLGIEHGASWLLPRIVGLSNALDLALSGRLLDAEEALRIGLVSRVVAHEQLMPTALEMAGEIATNCSP